MQTGLKGRRALVCASTSGLGLATARSLAEAGAMVAITGRRETLAQSEAARLEGAIGIGVDLTNPEAPERVVAAVRDRMGGIDILVLNSGGPPSVTALGTSAVAMADAINLILLPAVRLIGLCVPAMQEQGWGRVIAIGSSGVIQPIKELATSNAARAALAAYLKTLASEVADAGVTVNMVVPGRFSTDRVAALDQSRADRAGVAVETIRERSVSSIPAGRYGDPAELGSVVTFLATEAAAFVTGSVVRVDGGMIPSLI